MKWYDAIYSEMQRKRLLCVNVTLVALGCVFNRLTYLKYYLIFMHFLLFNCFIAITLN